MPKITYIDCKSCNAINTTYKSKDKKTIEHISCWRCKKILPTNKGYTYLMGFTR
jgi:hypothetical protein